MIRDGKGNIELYGHESEFRLATAGEIKNLLVYGPNSVGKYAFLMKVVEYYNNVELVQLNELTLDTIDSVKQESLFSKSSNVKVIYLNLGFPSVKLREKLLKIVEDAPDTIKFFVTSLIKPELMLRSRFTAIGLGHLSNVNAQHILMRLGYSLERASELAACGLGTVNPTINLGKTNISKPLVLQALENIKTKQDTELDGLYSKWNDEHTALIKSWATERITGRWREFEADDIDLSKSVAMKVLTRVDPFDRPRYVVRYSLMSIVREEIR